MRYLLIYILFALTATGAYAQADRAFIRSGNRFYHKQQYDKAEVEYRKALGKNPDNPQAAYNLGCALMAQQKDSAAITQYELAGKLEKAPRRKALVYHNIGVVCQQHQLYAQAIKAYKESLRNNPADDQTRYNLALCQRQQKNQQKNDGGKNNQNNNQQNKDKQQQKKQNKNQQQQQQQQNQQQQKEQMSRENAEQLLNAAMQEEKATQQRLKNAERQGKTRRLQKNW